MAQFILSVPHLAMAIIVNVTEPTPPTPPVSGYVQCPCCGDDTIAVPCFLCQDCGCESDGSEPRCTCPEGHFPLDCTCPDEAPD